MAKQYRKKPVVIEAMLFTGLNQEEIRAWFDEHGADAWVGHNFAVIYTLEGDMKANIGDYIIRGVQGEFYPCKPDIFAETYEAVENGNQ